MIKQSHALFFVVILLVLVLILTFTGIFTVNLLHLNGSQFTLMMSIFVSSMVIGLIWKLILDKIQSNYEITWTEYLIGGVVVGLLFSILGVNVGWKIAINNKVKYNEFWNGWEISTNSQEIKCTKDGPCLHEYSCDPYLCNPHECNCVCTSRDKDGNCTSESCQTCWDTCYHDCPYATYEYVNTVDTTLGLYTIDDHVFAINPDVWRTGHFIPGGVQKGPSQFWMDAKNRCDLGNPGPVTKRNQYENYILASDTTILKEYSSQIEQFKNEGVLPDINHDIHDFYNSDKVYFVGIDPDDKTLWQKTISYFNAALGTELQGDLHLVIVKNLSVGNNPDVYMIALKAYWQDTKVFKKDTVSKNAIIVVLGTNDGKTVSWSRTATGMPVGNEMMLVAIQNHLSGLSLSPEVILGDISGQFYQKTKDDGTTKTAVEGIGESGALRRIIWGMDDPATKFARVSMSSSDDNDNGTGFEYLKSQIRPDFSQQLVIILVCLFLSCIVWFVDAYAIGERSYQGHRHSSFYI